MPIAVAPLPRVTEGVGQDGQRGREDEGGGQTHQRPGADQHVHRSRQPGEDREPGEGENAQRQRALSPETIPEAAPDEQESGERQRVGVDDPLQLAVRGVQLLAHPGQRHVDDGVVHHREEHAEA